MLRMADRKWKETKQQPSMLSGSAVPGSCLVSFNILWAILSTSTRRKGTGHRVGKTCVWCHDESLYFGCLTSVCKLNYLARENLFSGVVMWVKIGNTTHFVFAQKL